MHLHHRIFAVALALLAWSLPAMASAQMTVTFTDYNGRGTPASGVTTYFTDWPISQAECTTNAAINFQVSNAPFVTGTNLVWALWQGGSTTGADCQLPGSRRVPGGGTPACTLSAWDGGTITSTTSTLMIPPGSLLPDGCPENGTYTFYLMAVGARDDTAATVAASHYFTFQVRFDRTAPAAPTVSNAAGDRQIQLNWANATSDTLAGANVYVDTSVRCTRSGTGDAGSSTGDGDAGVAGSRLVAGQPAPSTLRPVASPRGTSLASAMLDGEALGLSLPGSALVAVTVLDTARNESVLSNVACIERVSVSGFWNAYCAENMLSAEECNARYSGCTASPGNRRFGVWGLVGVAALLTVVGRRKRARGAR